MYKGDKMRYPNSSKTYHKIISHANRGMALEELINEANKYYLDENIALIYKKPTPIGIVNVKTDGNSKTITKAFFKEPSTLDYNGIYKGYYIEFDAKETKSKTSFPLANISNNQLNHIKLVNEHQGIVFLIISIDKNYYLMPGSKLLTYISSEKRKSIPISYIKTHAYQINSLGLIRLNYLEEVNKIIGGLHDKVKEIY